jgi:hypothetical protein
LNKVGKKDFAMLKTVKGIYENGQVILEEPLDTGRAKVIVTVIEELESAPRKPRKAGSMRGKIWIADDFNEPLDDLKDYM